ncbi:MAG: hypothetical protein AAF558_14435 [Verrucomicrobiota bacterium]
MNWNWTQKGWSDFRYLDERREMMQWWSNYLEEKSSSIAHS